MFAGRCVWASVSYAQNFAIHPTLGPPPSSKKRDSESFGPASATQGAFGKHFVKYVTYTGSPVAMMLKQMGENMPDFLSNLNHLHQAMQLFERTTPYIQAISEPQRWLKFCFVMLWLAPNNNLPQTHAVGAEESC
eukprot:5289653-Amphidinium_carterae.1